MGIHKFITKSSRIYYLYFDYEKKSSMPLSLVLVSPATEVCHGFLVTESWISRSIFNEKSKRISKKQGNWAWNVAKQQKRVGGPVLSSMLANPTGDLVVMSSEQRVYDVVLKQAALVNTKLRSREDLDLDVQPDIVVPGTLSLLGEAYDRSGDVCAEYAKTFYLGRY